MVFLMFGIGLKTKLSDLLDVGKVAITIAAVSIIIPFLGGYAIYFLFGNDTNVAIMLGTALFASSTTITANMLNYFGISETKQGKLIIGISIIVDIICLVILAVNTSIVSPVHEHSWWMNIVVILVFVILVFLFIAHTKKRKEKRQSLMNHLELNMDDVHKGLFIIAIIICFGLTAFSYVVGLSGIIGAFLAGMYFAEFESSSHIHEKFDTLTRFLLPFFFIYVGLRLHFDVMGINTLVIAVILIIIAIVTKYVGGYMGCKICNINNADSSFIASCIVARGDIAIIVATLAHALGLFNTDMYAAVIIMAVTTQIIAPMIINKMYKKTELCSEMKNNIS